MDPKVGICVLYWTEKSSHNDQGANSTVFPRSVGDVYQCSWVVKSPISGLVLSSRGSPWCLTVVF